jgi:peroxiredoxin
MKSLRRTVVGMLAAAAVVTGLVACTGKDAVDQSGGNYRFVSGNTAGKTIKPADRKKAGDFTGDLLNGGKLSLAQEHGKVVVINFWATWCGPCTTETPQFDSVYRAYKAKGVTFVGIDTKDQSGKAKAFVKNNDISYPIIFDEQGQAALTLGKIPALALPFTVVVDKQGRVAAVYINRLSAKDLEPVINKVLAGQ